MVCAFQSSSTHAITQTHGTSWHGEHERRNVLSKGHSVMSSYSRVAKDTQQSISLVMDTQQSLWLPTHSSLSGYWHTAISLAIPTHSNLSGYTDTQRSLWLYRHTAICLSGYGHTPVYLSFRSRYQEMSVKINNSKNRQNNSLTLLSYSTFVVWHVRSPFFLLLFYDTVDTIMTCYNGLNNISKYFAICLSCYSISDNTIHYSVRLVVVYTVWRGRKPHKTGGK